jgi:DNA-directed RNA polymerase subunit M/transcription elongation factor TFIIS
MSDVARTAETKSMVCQQCRTGLLVFVQTGSTRQPEARIYKCTHCGAQEAR